MRRGHQIGMVALGLGIDAVLDAASATAAHDGDWFRPTDLSQIIPEPAVQTDAPTSDPNLAVALFGIPVFQEGIAHVYSSFGSGLLAIADGADSVAQTGGFFNTAIAMGDDSTATAGGAAGIFDVAGVFGDNSAAMAGSDPDVGNSGSFDLAAVFGNLLDANATGGIFQVDIVPLF